MAPTFAKVFKEMIVVTDPHKPLPRAAKGTVIRKQALALYAEEIENACVQSMLPLEWEILIASLLLQIQGGGR